MDMILSLPGPLRVAVGSPLRRCCLLRPPFGKLLFLSWCEIIDINAKIFILGELDRLAIISETLCHPYQGNDVPVPGIMWSLAQPELHSPARIAFQADRAFPAIQGSCPHSARHASIRDHIFGNLFEMVVIQANS